VERGLVKKRIRGSDADDSSVDEAAGKEFGRGAHKSKKAKN
jgi:hypothetical protein